MTNTPGNGDQLVAHTERGLLASRDVDLFEFLGVLPVESGGEGHFDALDETRRCAGLLVAVRSRSLTQF